MSSLTGRVIKGVFFTVGLRWTNRLIGLASTLILARLLMPEDFGIVAMGTMVLALVATLLDTGVNMALIRNTQATAAHYHSAWTLRLMQAGAIACVLVAASPFAGDYFRDARITPVLQLMALNLVIGNLENIGIVTFQKEMQFGREFRYALINRLFGFAATLTLAFALRSYWALVIAGSLGAVFGVVHSYLAHPMRPRLSTEKLRELFSVSQWLVVQNIGGYFDGNLHKLLVGRRDDTATMGAYTLAVDLAALPSSELLQPLNRVLFPAFVSVKHDLAQLKRAFLIAQGVQVMVALPAAVILSFVAADVVAVLLGDKWKTVVPLLQVLAIGTALGALSASAWYVSMSLGRERQCAALAWAQVGLFVVLAMLVWPEARAQGIAQMRVLVSACVLCATIWIAARALGNLGLLDMLRGTWRTALALGLAAAVLGALPPLGWPALLSLVTKAGLGAGVYAGALWTLWWLCGRPDGAERFVLDLLASAWRRMFRGVQPA